ncbi:MAG: YgaP family membrane protein [Allorhizobium sp.]
MFAKNVGTVDRVLRVVLGLVVLSLFFLYPNAPWRYLALIGIVPLVTGLMSTCPLYSMLGMSTCPLKKN